MPTANDDPLGRAKHSKLGEPIEEAAPAYHLSYGEKPCRCSITTQYPGRPRTHLDPTELRKRRLAAHQPSRLTTRRQLSFLRCLPLASVPKPAYLRHPRRVRRA